MATTPCIRTIYTNLYIIYHTHTLDGTGCPLDHRLRRAAQGQEAHHARKSTVSIHITILCHMYSIVYAIYNKWDLLYKSLIIVTLTDY